jgi:hypothetical protein
MNGVFQIIPMIFIVSFGSGCELDGPGIQEMTVVSELVLMAVF